jgi:hypothetical protein
MVVVSEEEEDGTVAEEEEDGTVASVDGDDPSARMTRKANCKHRIWEDEKVL